MHVISLVFLVLEWPVSYFHIWQGRRQIRTWIRDADKNAEISFKDEYDNAFNILL